jgi:hypothetical protein
VHAGWCSSRHPIDASRRSRRLSCLTSPACLQAVRKPGGFYLVLHIVSPRTGRPDLGRWLLERPVGPIRPRVTTDQLPFLQVPSMQRQQVRPPTSHLCLFTSCSFDPGFPHRRPEPLDGSIGNAHVSTPGARPVACACGVCPALLASFCDRCVLQRLRFRIEVAAYGQQ